MLGVDRVCINPQTMNDSTLKLIGRNHDEKGVVQSVEWARQAGIKKINMDLIVGLPGEDIQENTYTAKKILKLKADNLTVHTLALKRGSLMAELEGKSRIEERLREVQKGVELFSNLFREQGYIPYYMYRQKYMKANMENIAFAMQGSFCLYNIQMIEERQTIIGMGGGAASKFVQTGDWSLSSVHNPKNPKTYCESVEKLIKRKFDKLQALN
jgi:oxygen-independent coproporphyrinogen-3 oxidase